MANPQAENGHVDISNEIIEALARQVISPDEWRVLMVIFRKTYGWHKKDDRISNGQFSEMTGIPRNHVPRVVNKLLSRRIIIKVSPIQGTGVPHSGDGIIATYGFQKDFDKWVGCPPNRGLSPIQDRGVPHSGQKVSPKQGNTKETIQKKITKEIKIMHGEFKNVGLTEEEHSKLISQFGEHGTQDRIENLSQYIASKGKKYSSHYATILNWERKNNPEGALHVKPGTDRPPLDPIDRRIWEAEKRLRGNPGSAIEKNS